MATNYHHLCLIPGEQDVRIGRMWPSNSLLPTLIHVCTTKGPQERANMKTHNSPQKQQQLVLSGLPLSPLTCKCQDQCHLLLLNHDNPSTKDYSPGNLLQHSEEELLYTMEMDKTIGEVPDFPTIPVSTLSLSHVSTNAFSPENPMASIAQETHSHRLAQHDAVINDTRTQTAYSCHLTNYQHWWAQDQDQHIQDHWQLPPPQPAHPITATKVALFLWYESMQELKVCPVGIQCHFQHIWTPSSRQDATSNQSWNCI